MGRMSLGRLVHGMTCAFLPAGSWRTGYKRETVYIPRINSGENCWHAHDSYVLDTSFWFLDANEVIDGVLRRPQASVLVC